MKPALPPDSFKRVLWSKVNVLRIEVQFYLLTKFLECLISLLWSYYGSVYENTNEKVMKIVLLGAVLTCFLYKDYSVKYTSTLCIYIESIKIENKYWLKFTLFRKHLLRLIKL